VRPIIVTPYNSAVDVSIVYHQREVVNKLRSGIPFMPYDYTGSDLLHPDACNKLVHRVFYEYQEGADCVLFLDIDCIPLSREALEWTFYQAYSGKLVGNAQRSNHYKNDQHVYAAPSYFCFTRETYESAWSPTMSFSRKYDCGELLTVNCRKAGVPVELLMPKSYDSTNLDGELWDLADGMPKYGIGTTFSNGHLDVSYHLFCSRFGVHTKYFVDRCKQILHS
jgi:hypothetical protein